MNKNSPLKQITLALCLAGICAPAVSQASLLLGFDHGGSSVTPNTSDVDAFSGKAGEGWNTPWVLKRQSSTASSISANVLNTNPFSATSGNYLSIVYRSLSASNARAGVSRAFSTDVANGGVNLAKPITIGFNLRFDDFSGSLNEATDQFLFSTDTSDALAGFTTSSPIRIWYVGGTGWRVNDGTNYVLIPEAPTTINRGDTFHFQITITPQSNTWSISLNTGGHTYSKSELAIYKDTSIGDSTYLGFRTTRGLDKTITWSLDQVQAIPEPQTAFLLVSPLLAAALFSKKLPLLR